MSNPQTFKFLDEWWLQNLIFTTQDQLSFPYSLWKHRILPYTLPSKNITGNAIKNNLFHQLPHGQLKHANRFPRFTAITQPVL